MSLADGILTRLRLAKHIEGEALFPQLFGCDASQQCHAVALAIGGCRFTPKETTCDCLVLKVHLVADEANEGKVQVERFHIFRLATRHKHSRSQILRSIACNDRQQAVKVNASAKNGKQEHDGDKT